MRLEAEQLRSLGVNGALNGHILVESDGDPNPGYVYRLIKDNRTAVVDPGINNDQTQGYAPGSLWINIAAGENSVWWCGSAATGTAVWHRAGGILSDPGAIDDIIGVAKIAPGESGLGTRMDYHNMGSVSASVIQYARIWLSAGRVFDRMRTYIHSGATGARFLRMGIYDQTDPKDETLPPNNRVTQTNSVAPVLSTAIFDSPLTNAPTGGSGTPLPWTVPVTGYYWIAFVTSNTAIQFATSNIYPQDFPPVYRETGALETLPASPVGPLTNPLSAIVYTATVEQ